MSAKLDIYNDIDTALKGITTNNVRDIKHVAIWNNQIFNEAREKAYNFPAVFVEFTEMLWETRLAGSNAGAIASTGQTEEQNGNITVILHVVFSTLKDETYSFPDVDAILDKVYFAIQNLQGANSDSYSPLLRVAERQDIDHDRVIDWQVDFNIQRVVQEGQNNKYTEIGGGLLDLEVEPLDC